MLALKSWIQVAHFYRLTRRPMHVLWLLALLLGSYALLDGLWWVPADYQQGDAFRIIYIHVPAAFWSLGVYAALGAVAALHYIFHLRLARYLLDALAPIGAALTALALITGAIWGKPMWGTWWVWDARLTSELLLFFLYVAVMALRANLPVSPESDKIVDLFSMIGLLNLPIIHFSVDWWHTLHQGPTLSRLAKPSMAPEMLYPLLAMIVAMGCYVGAMTLYRTRWAIAQTEHHKRWFQEMRT